MQQLIGRYVRLREELKVVFRARPHQSERAQRLLIDLRETRAAMLKANLAADEQTGDSLAFATHLFLPPTTGFGEMDWPETV